MLHSLRNYSIYAIATKTTNMNPLNRAN